MTYLLAGYEQVGVHREAHRVKDGQEKTSRASSHPSVVIHPLWRDRCQVDWKTRSKSAKSILI